MLGDLIDPAASSTVYSSFGYAITNLWDSLVNRENWIYSGVEPPPMPVAPAAPQTEQQMTIPAGWTPDQMIADSWAKQMDTWKNFFAAQDIRNNAGNTPIKDSTNWLLWGVIGLSAIVLIRR